MLFFVSLQPERISGEQYGIHADVWSVGISFMEVVLFVLFLLMISKPNLQDKVSHICGIYFACQSRKLSIDMV